MTAPYLLSAAAAVERVLSRRHPGQQIIVTVKDAPTQVVKLEATETGGHRANGPAHGTEGVISDAA
jgi:hypothetical protein